MDNFTEFWDNLGYNRFFLISLIVLFFWHIISMIYRSMALVSKKKPDAPTGEGGVSVIITCSNKAELLEKNLEAFLTQDYPQYEVVVVDECSEDETQDVLSDLQQKYPHLRTSRIFPDTKFRRTKKIAINIGVLAAQYDVLLFSEINCVPETKDWIRTMQSYFEPNTAVVIGYSNYSVGGEKNSIRRYFRFLWFWKTLMLVKHGMNVVGNAYNMGYRKRYYLEKRGFSRNTQEYIGFDTEMVKELAKKGSVRMVKEPEARMIITDDSQRAWEDDYSYYYASLHSWPLHVRVMSNIDFVVEFMFYVLSFYFIFSGILHNYIAIPVILTFLIDVIVINICLKHLVQRKLFLTSFSINTFGFIYKWYYSIYSIFTSKKWR